MIELLYFSAAWCGPCKMVAPIVAQLKAEGHNIRKIDVDQERAIAQQYGVMAMPTFIVLKDGVPVKRVQGAQPRANLEALLTANYG